jgi:PAS domain S-box-containing protein
MPTLRPDAETRPDPARDRADGAAKVVRLHEPAEALLAPDADYRNLLNALPAAIYTTDAAGRITFYNEAAVEFSGRRPQIGDEWCVTWKLFNLDGSRLPHDQCPMAVTLRERRPVRGAEAVAERPDGTRRIFQPYPTPIFGADGQLVGAVNMLVDITERKAADERQRLLSNEVDHRANNLLAVVQALVRMAEAPTVPELKRALEGRIKALAHAHVLLTQSRWTGADLQHLVTEEIAPFMGGASPRVWLSGPVLTLEPSVAQSMSMILHELATNAVRHGALSSQGGRVMIDWQAGPAQDLVFRWTEVGGPPVSPPPALGMGVRLIDRTVEHLKARRRFDWRPEGLVFELSAPLTLLVAQPDVTTLN